MQHRPYFTMLLLSSIIGGGLFGYQFHDQAILLKPFGDVFIYLLLFTVIPLGFFSISAAIAQISQSKQLLSFSATLLLTFFLMGLFAASYMLMVVKLFPLTNASQMMINATTSHVGLLSKLADKVTLKDFVKSLSHDYMLPLIFISILIGIAISFLGKRGILLSKLLQTGSDIFLQAVSIIMYYAPIGFFAYFATIVSGLSEHTSLIENYMRVSIIYYAAAIFYFIFAFSFFAYIAGRFKAVSIFWQNISTLVFTALATCSSAACLPINLQTAKEMGVSPNVYETVIPLGTILHKQGSILGGITKIAFLFSLYHIGLSGLPILLSILIVGLLVGTVMGAIPGGGMLGEMLIVSCYGFPSEVLVMIVAISVIIDPLATILNVSGNTLASLLVDRYTKSHEHLQLSPG
jgi:Na+/H+-dicarboxylate symporter